MCFCGNGENCLLSLLFYKILSTTIYLWLIFFTASKELSILLLKLYNDGAIGISSPFLDFTSVKQTDNQLLMNRQFGFYMKHKTAMKNNLINILDQTYTSVPHPDAHSYLLKYALHSLHLLQ